MSEQKELVIKDPDNYRRMAEPFESDEAAQAAMTSFSEELYELRNKHRIRDIVLIAAFGVRGSDGDEGDAMLMLSAGSQLIVPSLCAFAFGQSQAEADERIRTLTKRGIKSKIKRGAKDE